MLTYDDALALFDRPGRKIGGWPKLKHNTSLVRRNGFTLAVLFHSTYVVLIRADGTYTIHSGGFETVITADRVNRYSPIRVYSVRRRWRWCPPGGGPDRPFVDGLRVDQDGKEVPDTPMHAAFERAIKVRPEDEASWAAYSDWLLENGEEARAAALRRRL